MSFDTAFSAGYGIRDITPDYSVPLAGFGNTQFRMSKTVLEPIHAICVAMTDAQGQTLLMYQLDLVRVRACISDPVASYFREHYGIEREFIHITATHSESAPDTSNEDVPCIPGYNRFVTESLIAAGEEALADRSAASLEYGTTETQDLNFVKHVFLSTGVAIGDNHGSPRDGKIVRHTTGADNVMLVLRLRRREKKDIVLVNWRAHNQFTSGAKKTELSADYVGAFRAAAEEKLGCLFAYFQGCAGNVNPYSYIRSEERTRDYRVYGKYLAEHLSEIYDHLTPAEPGPIRAERIIMTAQVNHSMDGLLDIAVAIREKFERDNDLADSFRSGRPYGIYSAYHAGAIRARARRAQTEDFPVSVWSVGRLAFACTPFETFDTNGVFIRENSPYDMTFVMGYSDQDSFYVPSAYAYGYGCYEADSAPYVIGTGERIAAKTVEMLVAMYYRD